MLGLSVVWMEESDLSASEMVPLGENTECDKKNGKYRQISKIKSKIKKKKRQTKPQEI